MYQENVVKITIKAMNILLYRVASIGIVTSIFLFTACQDRNEEANLLLNENEICFNEKLVSITQNGENYYIGTESSGRIYVYSSEKNDVIDTLNTKYGRIYQVKQAKEANTFYVGTQNKGLKKAHKEGDRLITDTTYFIKGKEDRYSCYDVFIDNDAIYAMTSHGIYQVVQSDTLKPIYAFFVDGNPNPFVASNMVKGGDYYFGATSKGLVRITPIINDTTTIPPQKDIKNVVCYNDTIYALSDSLYRIEPDNGKVIDAFELKTPAKIYYRADGINYFPSENQLTLAHDTTLLGSLPELHKKVRTRRQLSVEGRNNMIADSKDYSLLVTDHALWQVGHHLPSVFGELKEGGIKQACTGKNSVYFLMGKKVYKLDNGIVAKEVLELNEKGDINLMVCSLDGDSLYYVNQDNVVFRQSINKPWYKFRPNPADSIGKPEKEITAMCVHNSVPGVILALRDSLIFMSKDATNAIKLTHNDKEVSFPYIRRFTVGNSIFAPTMNDGLFCGKGKELHIVEGTENLQFIRDVAYSELFGSTYILTNRHLYLRSNIIDNKNYGSRLLVSKDMIYIPGEVGGVRAIRLDENDEIQTDTILFPDITFSAESSLILNDTLYLGGPSGIIALSNQDVKEMIYQKGTLKFRYVKFEDKTNDLSYFSMIISLLVGIAIVLVVLFFRERTRRLNAKDVQELMAVLSDKKERYETLANKNTSRQDFHSMEGQANSAMLKSIIAYYDQQIKIEEEFSRYKIVFEEKEKILHVEDTIVSEMERNDRVKIVIKALRAYFGKKSISSKEKIDYFTELIAKIHIVLLEELKNHIKDKMTALQEELSEEDEDALILRRLLNVYERISDEVKSFGGKDATKLFNLIDETTTNDGRIAMVLQMREIRKEVEKKEINVENLRTAIERFYIPVIAYDVDRKEVYDHLITITIKEDGSPKRIRGRNDLVQQPFVILAVAMAKQSIPDKCTPYFSGGTDAGSIGRAKRFVEKWLNDAFSTGLEIENKDNPLYYSVSAFYLAKLAK